MKKGRKYSIALLVGFIFLFLSNFSGYAQVPYKTLTQGPNGELVETQTAYEPIKVIKLPTFNPEDLYLSEDGLLYVADTGNGRILVLKDDKLEKVIGEGILSGPTGIYVTDYIYVADPLVSKVYVFDLEGNVISEIAKPESPLFGKNTKFIPKKIAVDSRGNMYIVSEGSSNGLVQLNNEGEFTGFFASNMTNTSLKMIIQRLMYGSGASVKLMKNLPPSPTNVVIDQNGLVYTVTKGLSENSIKKFNVSGKNILADKMDVSSESVIDVKIDKYGNIFSIDENGYLYEFDSYGNLLFVFGDKEKGTERVGLSKTPSAFEVGNDGVIYLLDKEKNMLQLYQPTAFTHEVHEGITLYKEGLYIESEGIWQNILKMNSSFILSYQALAKSYFKRDLNEEALKAFKLAEDKSGYSEAFWEIRNDWLQSNLGIVLIVSVIIYMMYSILKRIDLKKGIFNSIRRIRKRLKEIKLISDVLYMKHFLVNPLDAYYELKRKNRVSLLGATLLYIWFTILQITEIYAKGYLFTWVNPIDVSIIRIIVLALVPIILWTVSNYLVSTINDGEGRFKDIYKGTIYALSPYLTFALPLQLLTNVLTLNESFIYSFSMGFIITWCAILLFLMVKEVHNYTIGESIKNILLTLFGIVLIVLTLFILILLINHELDFIESIVQELKIRV